MAGLTVSFYTTCDICCENLILVVVDQEMKVEEGPDICEDCAK